jgi:hypothetical protein
MPELSNPMDERFARLLAVGLSQNEAYKRSGFAPDKSNASKRSRQPEIVERIAELQAEEKARVAQLRAGVSDRSGYEELKEALKGAVGASQWSAAVSAAKHLAEMDGSAEQFAPDDRMDSAEQILKLVDQHGPVWGTAVRMMCPKTDISNPWPDDSDISVCEEGLRHWFSPEQIQALGRRLLTTKSAR